MQQSFLMSYNVETIPVFEKQVKRLIRKYPSLKQELFTVVAQLQDNPFLGISLGNSCYKIRIAIASKGKGKRGGARIVTHIVVSTTTVYLLNIFDKSKKETLTDSELEQLLQFIPTAE